jgi:hypothetical protein
VVQGETMDYCQGRLHESFHELRGVVTEVRALRPEDTDAVPLDSDPRFAITVDVGHVVPPVPAHLCPGQSRRFAVHSPSATLPPDAVGKALDMKLVVLACDGAHWQDLALLVDDAAPLPYEGRLDVGVAYVDRLVHDPRSGWELSRLMDLPYHHAGGVRWLNEADFPELAAGGPSLRATFLVLSRDTEQMEERRWLTLYTCRLIRIDPAPEPAGTAATRPRAPVSPTP